MVAKGFSTNQDTPDYVHLRATDVDTEGVYVDSKYGDLVFFTNWDDEQPNNWQNQDYVTMHALGKWHDFKEVQTAFTICQK